MMDLTSFDAMQEKFQTAQQNYPRLCRFCLNAIDLLEIFKDFNCANGNVEWTYSEQMNVGTLLKHGYLAFSPAEESGLPHFICEQCVQRLTEWHKFQQMFASTTKLLVKTRDQLGFDECLKRDDSVFTDEYGDVESVEYLLEEEELKKNEEYIVIANERFLGDKHSAESVDDDTVDYCSDDESVSGQIKKEEFSKVETKSRNVPKKKWKRDSTKLSVPETSSTKQQGQQCPICGVIVKEKLNHHIMRHNDPSGRPFKCEKCDKSYSFKRTLANHIRQVHENIRYQCDVCLKKFTSKDVLRIHKNLHSNEEHRCEVCGQMFSQRMYLRKHMVVHERKKFTCDQCGKCFRFKELMKQHMRIHTGEKPFQCQECPKSFRTSSHLKQHHRTHGQLKVFKCKQCSVAYANKKSLVRHVALEHQAESDR